MLRERDADKPIKRESNRQRQIERENWEGDTSFERVYNRTIDKERERYLDVVIEILTDRVREIERVRVCVWYEREGVGVVCDREKQSER